MGFIGPICAALAAAFNVYQQERAIYNRPDIVAGKLAAARQQSRDRLTNADAVAEDPSSTPAQKVDAMRQIRLAHS
jgi:hypothetical protein